jgi:methionine sulfoxide reductase heme-binding subunit
MAAPRLARWSPRLGWALGALPALWLAVRVATDGLGAEPIEEATHITGFSALTLLLGSLAITPLRRLEGWNGLIGARRSLGLSAFGYAGLHFAIYLLDQGFALEYIVEDVAERWWVTVGFGALLLLVPVAVTSTKGWIRRLGKRWQKLHRLVYLAAGLGVLHFFLLVKEDVRRPLLFAAAFALLMALRLPLRRLLPAARRETGPSEAA